MNKVSKGKYILRAPKSYHKDIWYMPKGTLRNGAIGKRQYRLYAIVASTKTRLQAEWLMEDLRQRSIGIYAQHYRGAKEAFKIDGSLCKFNKHHVALFCKDPRNWQDVHRLLKGFSGNPLYSPEWYDLPIGLLPLPLMPEESKVKETKTCGCIGKCAGHTRKRLTPPSQTMEQLEKRIVELEKRMAIQEKHVHTFYFD